MSEQLGTVCTVCGTERRRKTIAYDPETFLPYCANPFNCNENHPNTHEKVVKRAVELGDPELGEIKLLPFHEAEKRFAVWVEMQHKRPKEESERLARMTTRPVTFRIGNFETAEFLLQYQKAYNFNSVSDVVRHCIETVMEEFDSGVREMPVAPIPPEEQEVTEDNETRHEQPETEEETEWSF